MTAAGIGSRVFVVLTMLTVPSSAAETNMRASEAETAMPSEPLALGVRCGPGFRKSTITARCVRARPRFPLPSGWLG